jgi:hypothetical protein
MDKREGSGGMKDEGVGGIVAAGPKAALSKRRAE